MAMAVWKSISSAMICRSFVLAYRIIEKIIETFATRKEEYNLSLLKVLESLRVGEALMCIAAARSVFGGHVSELLE